MNIPVRFAFDHLVHFVHRPEQAVDQMRLHGLSAFLGGQHERWGTYNALSYFDLSYIEFLGVYNPELAGQVTDNDLVRQAVQELPHGERFARVAIRTDDIEAAAERMRSLGLSVTGPFPGSRKRADGSVLRWSMFFMSGKDGDELPLPFVIQWGESDERRRAGLIEQGAIGAHSAGPLRLRQVAFAVRDADAAAEKWGRLFQLPLGDPCYDETLKARCREIRLPGGHLAFCSPAEPGPTSDYLASKGAGPFFLRLSGAKTPGIYHLLGGYYQFIEEVNSSK
jgi:hypothetical protein